MSLPFRYYLRVRYGECDAQKVVFNARYGDYLDISLLEFLRAIGFGEAMAQGVLEGFLMLTLLERVPDVATSQLMGEPARPRVGANHRGRQDDFAQHRI